MVTVNAYAIIFFFLSCRQLYREYKNQFKLQLAEGVNVGDAVKARLVELEDKLDLANIVMAREHAKLEVYYYSN